MFPRMGPPSARENPLYVSFRNPQWPPNQITPDNVLDYFCNQANAFYEMNSCNQLFRMQNITNMTLEESLRQMTGIQYILWYAQPPLYIICKQRRNSPQNVSPISYYYVINGSVHMAPDAYSLIQSRLLGALEPLRNAFQEVTNYSRYNTAKGYYWEFKNKQPTKKKEEGKKEGEEEEKLEERSTNFQTTRTLALLNQLFDELPADEALERDPEVDEDEKTKTEEPTTSEPRFVEPAARPTTSKQ